MILTALNLALHCKTESLNVLIHSIEFLSVQLVEAEGDEGEEVVVGLWG